MFKSCLEYVINMFLTRYSAQALDKRDVDQYIARDLYGTRHISQNLSTSSRYEAHMARQSKCSKSH